MRILGKSCLTQRDSSTVKRTLSVITAALLAGALAMPVFGNEPKLRRKLKLGNPVTALAVGSEGTIYAGSNVGHVCALNPDSGALKWKWEFPSAGQIRALAVGHENAIYAGTDYDGVYALDPGSGSPKWKFGQDNSISTVYALAIGNDGTVYAGSDEGDVYALDPARGSLRGKFALEEFIQALAVGRDGTIYAGSSYLDSHGYYKGNVFALAPGSGALKWKSAVGGDVGALLVDRDGAIYAGSQEGQFKGAVSGGRVYALDPGGSTRWKSKIDFVNALAVGRAGDIYALIATDITGYICALDPRRGALRWKWKPAAKDDLSALAVGGNGIIYAGSWHHAGSWEGGYLYALSPP